MNQINGYAAQQKQQAMYESMSQRDVGIGICLGNSNAQLQAAGLIAAAPPMGVLAMTENAHEAFQRLSNALGELRDRLSPVTVAHPGPVNKESTENQIAEASAVVGLRVLVERIDSKTAEIHQLLLALRV